MPTCARCGGPVGNAGIASAAILSDMDFSTIETKNLLFCREPKGTDGTDPTCAETVRAAATDPNADTDYPSSQQAVDANAQSSAATTTTQPDGDSS